MTTQHTPAGLIGASVLRVEDPVLATGRGCYVGDVQLPGGLYLALLRSSYPHAKITSINTDAARNMPGVQLVLTGADIDINIPSPVMIPGQKIPPHPALARGAVHAVGAPVAAVVAPTRGQADRQSTRLNSRHDGM